MLQCASNILLALAACEKVYDVLVAFCLLCTSLHYEPEWFFTPYLFHMLPLLWTLNPTNSGVLLQGKPGKVGGSLGSV